jgi:pimeloyl-ACP methyl ester carboxylesterase
VTHGSIVGHGGGSAVQRLKTYHPFKSEEARDRYYAHYDALAEALTVPCEVRTVDSEHGRTLVRVSGPADAPPLVLLAPRGGTSLEWEWLLQSLADYRTFAVDSIYDFGRSVNAGPAQSVEDYPAWLDELFDALGLVSGVNLLGFSRGAWMAAESLVRSPGRYRKVAWLSPGALLLPYSPALMAKGMAGVPMMLAPSHFTCDLGTRWMMPDAAASTGSARAFYDRFLDNMAIGMKCFDLKAIDFMRIERVLSDDELRGIDVPVLYLAGEREKMYSASAGAARLNAVAPQIETSLIPGGGHDVTMLKPAAVTERLLGFFSN